MSEPAGELPAQADAEAEAVGHPAADASPPTAEQPPAQPSELPEAVGPDARHPEGPQPDGSQPEPVAVGDPAAADRVAARIADLSDRIGELSRLRNRDADLVDRLHAEIGRLRSGELATAMAPLLVGLMRLADRMEQLAAGDATSDVAMMRSQLVQVLDTAAAVTEFRPAAGEVFDASRHVGVAREPDPEPDHDGRVLRTVRPGYAHADGRVVRVAEVVVAFWTPECTDAPPP